MSEADIEQNQAGVRIVDDDVLDGKPKKELLLSQTDDADEAAVAEIGRHDAFEENSVLVLGEARAIQKYLEAAVGVEGVGSDVLRKEARREAAGTEEVVDGAGGGKGEEEQRDKSQQRERHE